LTVTVAIPVRNGGMLLRQVLEAVRAQRVDAEVEILVCDSGSSDGSVAVARSYGARVFEIPPREFSHGGTRNLLMREAVGERVALISQDATPADDRWLARLLSGFSLTEDVGLVFGPYRPRPDASPMVARELTEWFASFSPGGQPRIDVLSADERGIAALELLSPRGYFTDANGCISKAAWQAVPFRAVAYAEDHLLAHDMLRAGFAKVYLPQAAVIHSHDYSPWGWLQRSFDEARAVNEVYGFSKSSQIRYAALNVWGQVGADLRWQRSAGSGRRPADAARLAGGSLTHWLMRTLGTMLGTRAEKLPAAVVRRLSAEGRVGSA
jgi:rhamnosyltransferase